MPAGALALLPGRRRRRRGAGAATRACTRSRSPARARSAWRSSARPPSRADGQRHVKRVVAEMGGKNCVIVDADADLDEAVPGDRRLGLRLRGPEVLGRLARARRTRRIADALVERLAGAVEVLRGRPGRRLRHRRAAGDRARGAGARRALRGACAAATASASPGARRCPDGPGWFCAADAGRRARRPTPPCCARRSSARCSRSSAVAGVEAACDASTRCPFALTGGLFSRNPATVE